jgi:predicted O-linked N-acetylglucosamine transferase (SPINDLY family)
MGNKKRDKKYNPNKSTQGKTVTTPTAATYQKALALYNQGEYPLAMELCITQLLPFSPKHIDFLNLTAVCGYMLQDYDTALTYAEQAVQQGESAYAWFNYGLILVAQKKSDAAAVAYQHSVRINPNEIKAWNNLANLIAREGTRDAHLQAQTYYERVVAINPRYVQAHVNLGFTLEKLSDSVAAEKYYRQALALQANNMTALGNLAEILIRQKQLAQAMDCYRCALLAEPSNPEFLGSALALKRKMADWSTDDGVTPQAVIAAMRADPHSQLQPMHLMNLPEVSLDDMRVAGQRFAQYRWGYELRRPPMVNAEQLHDCATRRLRIGYLSADFRNHPVAHLMGDIIQHHNRSNVEVFLYAYGPPTNDSTRALLQQRADEFILLSDMNDTQAAQTIAAHQIDVLVDLTGYTTHTRLGITALRPAPVIASWLGFIGTLGEPRLADYIIGDAIATPPENAAYFSEKIAHMPECFQPNLARTPLPTAPTRVQEGLPDDAIVLCSFNQTFKLNPQLWDDWCAILRAVPQAVLWLAPASADEAVANLKREAQTRGVAPERIIFADKKPLPQHQARIALADFALDTNPYNSGTTASDVLRAGIPIITRMGDAFVSRMAGSLLHALGLGADVCTDRETYIAKAIEWAQNPSTLAHIKQNLNAALQNSSLFNPAVFTQHLEAVYRQMCAERFGD